MKVNDDLFYLVSVNVRVKVLQETCHEMVGKLLWDKK